MQSSYPYSHAKKTTIQTHTLSKFINMLLVVGLVHQLYMTTIDFWFKTKKKKKKSPITT